MGSQPWASSLALVPPSTLLVNYPDSAQAMASSQFNKHFQEV